MTTVNDTAQLTASTEPVERPAFFSVVSITKDNFAGLRKTHESLSSQDFDDFEWIVVDGESDDGTVGFLQDLADRARWVSEKDRSLYDAMNKGLRLARGRYVIFLNAGDEFGSESVLRRVHDVLSETQADFVYGDALEIAEDGSELYKTARVLDSLKWAMITHHQSMVYRRPDGAEELLYEDSFRIAGDWVFTLKFLSLYPNAAYVNEPICKFYLGGVSSTSIRRLSSEIWRVYRDVESMPLPTACSAWCYRLAVNLLRNRLTKVYFLLRARM